MFGGIYPGSSYPGASGAAGSTTLVDLTATQAQTATLASMRVALRTLTATQGTTATLARAIGRTVTATQSTLATLRKGTTRALTASQGQTAVLVKQSARTISTAQAVVAVLAKARLLTRVLAAIQGTVATLTRTTVALPPGTISLTIGGVARQSAILYESLTINDGADEMATTCGFVVNNLVPVVGQQVVIALINPPIRLFGGVIRTVEQTYADLPINVQAHVSASDWTVLANRRKVTKRYTAQSASSIATDLVSGLVGFTATHVVAGLDTIDEITFTNQDLNECLTQLAKRIGGYWYWDYFKDLHFFLNETADSPTPLTPSHPSMREIYSTRDMSQIITRVRVQGGGANALVARAVGDTTIPVEDGAWYSASGGVVESGPQRITYGGRDLGGIATTVVGNVPGPVAAPARALASGAGHLSGVYQWKVAFANASGETPPGPASTALTCPDVAAPSSAPTPSAVSSVIGALIGFYSYKYSFVTALGETTPSTAGTRTAVALAGPGGPSPSANFAFGGLLGSYLYKVGFVSAIGETLGSASASVSATALAAGAPTSAGSFTAGTVYYYVGTWVGPLGETNPGTQTSINYNLATHGVSWSPGGSAPTGATGWRLYRGLVSGGPYKLVAEQTGTTAITDRTADANLGQFTPSANALSTAGRTVTVSGIAAGPTGTLARRLYRTKAGGSTYFLVAEIADNTTGTYLDDAADASLSDAPPLQNLNGEQHTVSVGTGPVGTLARRIYRTTAGGSDYRLVATLSDNATTSITDNTPDSALGASVSLVNTAGASKVDLSSIAIGGAGVTQRILYRTKAGGAVYFYVGTINDNTTTTFTDDIEDGSLGRSPQVTSTIGALSGDTSVVVASTTGFPATGWVRADSQIIRYASLSGTTLAGIPASGIGAITGAIKGGLSIIGLPALRGIPASGAGSILYPILAGDPLNIEVTVDDVAAQTALAALLGGGDDGVQEDHMQDGRISYTEAVARAEAQLALRSQVEVSVTYHCRDPYTRAGKTISVNLPAPTNIVADFKIQQVTISQFQADGIVRPDFSVAASSTRFSLEDLLRLARQS